MGGEFNPVRAVFAVTTLGASEAVIEGAKFVGKALPFPTTCCGCPTTYHKEIGRNLYHCVKCGHHCGHYYTITDKTCYICGKKIQHVYGPY